MKLLTISLALNFAVALVVYAICETKRLAERQLLAHQTGTALVYVLSKLQTPEGYSQVQTVLSNQLKRDLRVKYTDLSTIIQQLDTTNAPPSTLNSQNKTI